VLAAVANDTAVTGVGGTAHRLNREHASVRMVSEHVGITVFPGVYEVTATFVFHNDGPACTVEMGFPESGVGDIDAPAMRRTTGFQGFRTWVDGAPASATRKTADVQEFTYKAFWVKSVEFAAGQTRTVKVQYRAKPGSVSLGSRFVSYRFSGGNWKGKVERSDLDIYLHLPETCMVSASASASDRKDDLNHFHYTWTQWQAETEFQFDYVSTWPEWLKIAGDTEGVFPLSGPMITLTNPGRLPALDWLPQGVVRHGTAFISIEALWRYLEVHAARPHLDKAITQSWDPATGVGTLRVHAVTLTFKLKSAAMTVEQDGVTSTVTMPAPAFLSRPGSGGQPGQLYVPVAPVVKALGGTVAVDGKAHRLTLTLPKPPAAP
jgi:hypothetical protein